MQAAAWNSLFRRIPVEQHNSLILMTATGAEIVLQRIIRLDGDFMVALGRMAGSTDQGKLLIIPFDQLTYLSFTNKLTDAEIEAALGKLAPAAASPEPQQIAVHAPSVQPPPVQPPPVKAPAAESSAAASLAKSAAAETPRPGEKGNQAAANSNQKPSPPSKSVLLARLRQRLADDISKRPHP